MKKIVVVVCVFLAPISAFASNFCASGAGKTTANGTYSTITPDSGATATWGNQASSTYKLNWDGVNCYIMVPSYYSWTDGLYTDSTCAGDPSVGSWSSSNNWAALAPPTIVSGVCVSTTTSTSTPGFTGGEIVADFFLFLIFVLLFFGFLLDRIIGVKLRKNIYNTYLGNNSREGKEIYHD